MLPTIGRVQEGTCANPRTLSMSTYFSAFHRDRVAGTTEATEPKRGDRHITLTPSLLFPHRFHVVEDEGGQRRIDRGERLLDYSTAATRRGGGQRRPAPPGNPAGHFGKLLSLMPLLAIPCRLAMRHRGREEAKMPSGRLQKAGTTQCKAKGQRSARMDSREPGGGVCIPSRRVCSPHTPANRKEDHRFSSICQRAP